jgi:hypothetical protein
VSRRDLDAIEVGARTSPVAELFQNVGLMRPLGAISDGCGVLDVTAVVGKVNVRDRPRESQRRGAAPLARCHWLARPYTPFVPRLEVPGQRTGLAYVWLILLSPMLLLLAGIALLAVGLWRQVDSVSAIGAVGV